MRGGWRRLAAAILFGLFALQVYRAATQSITVDEARVYMDFIHPDPPVLLRQYEAAHHVLQTYLSWLFAKWWGGSELALRLPALLASIAYFAFVFRFSGRLFGRSAMFFISVLVLAANPLILDHLALARGYGVALALFAWALMAAFDDRLLPAGILSGLSVAANLTFLIPACALAAAAFVFTSRRRSMLSEFLGPAAIVFALVAGLPLLNAKAEHFYYGAPSLLRTFTSLAEASLDRRFWGWGLATFGAVAGLLALALSAAGLVRGGREARFTSSTLALALAAAVGLHVAFGTPYPFFRTGIWVLFLITVAGLAGGCVVAGSYPRTGAAAAVLALVTGCAYLTQYDPRFAIEWRSAAAVKRFMQYIRGREAAAGRSFSVSGSLEYKFPCDYYRVRFGMDRMAGLGFEEPRPQADYYIFDGPDRHDLARQWGARLVEDDRLCLCLLAER